MLIKLEEYYSSENKEKYCFDANENTTVAEYDRYLLNLFWKTDYGVDDYTLSYIVSFNNDGIWRYARHDYSLLEFFNNFNFDINNIEVSLNEGYGRGAAAIINNDIKIQLNANEGKHHFTPHVHISRPYKHDKEYRINLNNYEQMKGDSEDWSKEFNRKERKKIIECLKNNSETLIDMYNRITKGEHIEENIWLVYEGRKIKIY